VLNSFKCRETEKIAHSNVSRKFSQDMQRVALRKLRQLEAAGTLDDLRIPPGNRLEPLKGGREGQHSIRINNQWRLCFRFENGDAYDVEIVDYHR
jgi:proteic killer suppression protein